MALILVSTALGLATLYLYHVNSAMKVVPEEVHKSSPHRWTIHEIKEAYKKSQESPVDVSRSIPPKQSRRYVVVGGSGMLILNPTTVQLAIPDGQRNRKLKQILWTDNLH